MLLQHLAQMIRRVTERASVLLKGFGEVVVVDMALEILFGRERD